MNHDDDDELPDLDDLDAQRADIERYVKLGPLEYAAEKASDLFDTLSEADKLKLHIRLLSLGTLHAGDLSFADRVAASAKRVVAAFVRQQAAGPHFDA